ncbi:MAG: ribose-phosphate diphosphokinase [Candidatus ainarchaeum sp.]|nr:ribose-phosphate diphosphokinase [Candidatus ainarchaeum sp.]
MDGITKLVSLNFSDLMEPNIEIKHFPDGENYIKLPEKIGEEIVVYHRLYPEPDNSLIQAILMLRGISEKSKKITLIAPYLSYSRQDKIWENGEVLSSKYICEMLLWAGVKKLITYDCHFIKKEGRFKYWGLEIENRTLSGKLIEYAKENIFKNKKFQVVSPDLGSKYMVGNKGNSMKKTRGQYADGKEARREISEMNIDFELKEKNVLIIDDMIAGGGTMLKGIEKLREAGAEKIACCATHGFFLKESYKKLSEKSDYLFVSNTIPNKASKVNFME